MDLSSSRVKKSVALFNLDPVDTPSLSSIKSKKEKTEVTKNESEEHSSENEEENKNKEQAPGGVKISDIVPSGKRRWGVTHKNEKSNRV